MIRRLRLAACAALWLAGTLAHAAPAQLLEQARAYEHGEGVAKDPERAAQLYCEAARGGDAEAQFALGWMYANGRGVERNDAYAARLFDLAADKGHEYAERMLRFVGPPLGALPACMARSFVHQPTPELALDLSRPAVRRVVELVRQLAPEYAVDPALALAVIAAESNFEPAARSPKNAQGLMQLIPETAERFNVRNVYDPAQNVRGGLAYLRWLLAYFRGDVALALAGYNAGEGAVERYRGVPPFAETREYVRRILEMFRRERHPYDATVVEPSPVLRTLAARTRG